MSRIEVVRFAASESVVWANGRGSTRVLVDDGRERGGSWTYRVSVAELAGAQSFSHFPGVDRHLTFLGPGALSISVNDAATTLVPFGEIRFGGEDAVRTKPSTSPSHDLNVMARRGVCSADVVQTHGVASLTSTASTALWISLQEGGQVENLWLERLDVARLPLGTPTQVSGAGVLIELRRVRIA